MDSTDTILPGGNYNMELFCRDCLTATSNTFIANANIFGKVYFPRLVLPFQRLFPDLIKFAIQFLLFVLVLIYFIYQRFSIHPNILGIIIVTPVVLL